jgi:hypothetical protein
MGNSETPGSSGNPTNQAVVGTAVKAAAQQAHGSTPSDTAWVDVAVPIALETGWTMAVLFGQLSSGADDRQVLPTEHELSEEDRVSVELTRLSCLLTKLKDAIPQDAIPRNGHQIDTNVEPLQKAYGVLSTSSANADGTSQLGKAGLNRALLPVNVGLLADLACASREVELAYQVGRSIRDTANPPSPMPPAQPSGAESPGATAPSVDRLAGRDRLPELRTQLKHDRVAVIQEWLKALGPHLPADSAAVVSKSLGRWSDFASTAFDDKTPGRLRSPAQTNSVVNQMIESLLRQGDVWLSLLTGQQATAGLLTPEGYVAAGEAALGRSARIVVRVVQTLLGCTCSTYFGFGSGYFSCCLVPWWCRYGMDADCRYRRLSRYYGKGNRSSDGEASSGGRAADLCRRQTGCDCLGCYEPTAGRSDQQRCLAIASERRARLCSAWEVLIRTSPPGVGL